MRSKHTRCCKLLCFFDDLFRCNKNASPFTPFCQIFPKKNLRRSPEGTEETCYESCFLVLPTGDVPSATTRGTMDRRMDGQTESFAAVAFAAAVLIPFRQHATRLLPWNKRLCKLPPIAHPLRCTTSLWLAVRGSRRANLAKPDFTQQPTRTQE